MINMYFDLSIFIFLVFVLARALRGPVLHAKTVKSNSEEWFKPKQKGHNKELAMEDSKKRGSLFPIYAGKKTYWLLFCLFFLASLLVYAFSARDPFKNTIT